MSSDVIIGHDGKPRCVWAGAGHTAFGRYHDEVWGTRTYDESALFAPWLPVVPDDHVAAHTSFFSSAVTM